MIKVSVMYPNGTETKFDVDYYKNSHLPMVVSSLGDALKGVEFSVGIGGRIPGELAPYVAVVDLKFESVAAFQAAFGPHAAVFAADVPNYTNVQGELQICEIL
ncbi:MAG: hypothetical protein ACI87N_002231 [Flavobacteriales bacterium]|jgi:uncharacterized protein (TIGR02118 family)